MTALCAPKFITGEAITGLTNSKVINSENKHQRLPPYRRKCIGNPQRALFENQIIVLGEQV